ncbi:dehydrodolichyl diphosphate synthetase, putative [Plasmodium gallinaceum]|uniref:Alkyl transferase n=1 Tax=Plasmodium gallinaceum TaxID=5849 RepID=A0A1J1GR26_PLAGA|nr:dehydrodolichyl diphosphate synthetase, putative [Plasmodium gallinaceum]CRG93490.1 dehydrodolichyl diphosphate synthetase, putative [Plasmodium gallinaceum]
MALNLIERLITSLLRRLINIKHISIIMDGNRRFAKDNGFHSSLGHYMGSKALIKIIEICISLNIKILSVFSLSLFNYNRSPQEIYFLFYLNLHCLSNEDFFNNFIKNNRIRIKIIGNLSYINDFYRKIINDIEQKTREFDNLILNIFFSYTSRNEMSLCKFMPNLYFDTYKKLLEEQNICYSSYSLKNYINENNCEHSENIIKNEHIESTSNCEIKCFCGKYSFLNEEQLNIYNYHKKLLTSDLPPPNILIRTSGEKRLSDFMLYQVSEFTEIYFINDHWPTFNFLHFIYIILHYTFFQTIEWEFSYSNPCPH